MEFCGDFGSSMSHHSWFGQQGVSSRPATFPSAVTFDQGAPVSTVPTWHQQLLAQQKGTGEHAPLIFHSVPTETIQPCADERATSVQNFQVRDSALAMECQKVPSVYATNIQEDCLTMSGQKPHHGTKTQSICDMLAHIQSKLQTMSENLSHDLKRMKHWETKQPAAQPTHFTQKAFNMSDEMPLYNVYAEEDNNYSTGFCSVLDTSLVNQQDGEREANTYPLERTTHGPVFDAYDDETNGCSHEFVDMFATNLDQQPYEEEQQASDQLLKCVSKATELKKTSACLHTNSDVQVFSLELQQEDDERAYSCSDLKASDSVVTRSSQLSIEHSMGELSLLWDPGASASLHSNKSKPPDELSYVAIVFPKVLTLCNQVGTYEQQLRDSHRNVLVSHERRKEWDPGDTKLHVLFMVAASATKLQCMDVTKSVMLQILAVQFGARAPIFEYAVMRSYAFGLGWIEVNASALFVLALPCSTDTSVVDEMLQNGSDHMPYPGAPASLQSSKGSVIIILQQLHCNNTYSMRDLSLEKGRQVQWDRGIKFILYELWWLSRRAEYVSRHLLAVKFGTHNYTYLSNTAAILCDPPGNLIQQRRTTAAMLHFWQYKLLSSVVCTWDPAIAFVHQQGVHDNHKAKRLLLALKKYFHIWKMDIIFITFLPP